MAVTELAPYLGFSGKCKEAMEFYAECLDAELNLQTVGSTPHGASMSPEEQDKIMHSSISKNNRTLLMASDMFDASKSIQGTTITLCLNCSSKEEIESAFDKLSQGGTVNEPLRVEFWGGIFGQLTDKYGFHWMLNCVTAPSK